MPYEKDFCATCNRLRVSSIGKLHLCLFGEGGVNLRDLLEDDTQQQALEARISAALRRRNRPISCIKTTPVLRKTYRTLAAKTSKGEIR